LEEEKNEKLSVELRIERNFRYEIEKTLEAQANHIAELEKLVNQKK
jgi:hypothetical protein